MTLVKHRNGFIHSAMRALIDWLRYLNLMEYFKELGSLLSREKKESGKRHKYVSNAVDLYTVLKWLTISWFWMANYQNSFTLIFTWYLLLTNLHTFIYYFLWKDDNNIDHERSKKRFIKLVLAIFFSDYCFAYLYQSQYYAHFQWDPTFSEIGQAIWYSISNSVAGNYDKVKPQTEQGYTLMMVQYMITFFYVGVLISKAIPQKSDVSRL